MGSITVKIDWTNPKDKENKGWVNIFSIKGALVNYYDESKTAFLITNLETNENTEIKSEQKEFPPEQ